MLLEEDWYVLDIARLDALVAGVVPTLQRITHSSRWAAVASGCPVSFLRSTAVDISEVGASDCREGVSRSGARAALAVVCSRLLLVAPRSCWAGSLCNFWIGRGRMGNSSFNDAPAVPDRISVYGTLSISP